MIDAVGLALAGMEDPAVDPLFFNEKIWHAVAVHLRGENMKLRVSVSDACDQLQRGVPIGVEMAEKILRAALGEQA